MNVAVTMAATVTVTVTVGRGKRVKCKPTMVPWGQQPSATVRIMVLCGRKLVEISANSCRVRLYVGTRNSLNCNSSHIRKLH